MSWCWLDLRPEPAEDAGAQARLYERDVQRRLGLRELTDTVHDPYLPVVWTLFDDLTIHRSYNGYWYWGRPTLDELRADMRAIARAIRPDWDPPAR